MTDKKAKEKGAVELTEDALDEASGGMAQMNMQIKAATAPAPGAAKIAQKVWGDPHIEN